MEALHVGLQGLPKVPTRVSSTFQNALMLKEEKSWVLKKIFLKHVSGRMTKWQELENT